MNNFSDLLKLNQCLSFQDVQNFIDENNEYIVFGAGGDGRTIKKWLVDQGKLITCFLDNDLGKHGQHIDGIPIYNPNTFHYENCKIIIASVYAPEIAKQLMEHSLKNGLDFITYENLGWLGNPQFEDAVGTAFIKSMDLEACEAVMGILADEESRATFKRIIDYRSKALDPHLRTMEDYPIPFSEYRALVWKWQSAASVNDKLIPQNIEGEARKAIIQQLNIQSYSYKDMVGPVHKRTIIDAGGYIGDTAAMFSCISPNGQVYTFEPIDELYHKVEQIAKHFPNVTPIKAGLWSESGKVNMVVNSGEDNASFISDGESGLSDVITLDEFVSKHDLEIVDFIKMDIEGAELEALKGAENTIRINKPDLAICIYHKPEHLWEIPLWIHEISPDYNIYIGHKEGLDVWGTVCYASVSKGSEG